MKTYHQKYADESVMFFISQRYFETNEPASMASVWWVANCFFLFPMSDRETDPIIIMCMKKISFLEIIDFILE